MANSDVRAAQDGTPWQETVWTCSLCAHCNLVGDWCEVCGVARRFLDDPPLDLPHTPRLSQLPSFWLSLVWGAAALAGLLALVYAPLRDTIGVGFLLLEVVAAGAAAVSSFFTALWERMFNKVEVILPPHAAAGSSFEARLLLAPYSTLDNVTVRLKLSDRYFERIGDKVESRTKELVSLQLLSAGRLPGRRSTQLSARFRAPFPINAHASVQAELSAQVLRVASVVVPSLRFAAANLAEHGGFYVEAYVRVGPLSRRFHKRIVTYAIGHEILVG